MIRAFIFDWGDTLMKDFKDYSGPMVYWPKVELMPNVNELLAYLDSKYLCCVASNAGDSDRLLMEGAIKRVGINGYFQHYFTSKELGYNKPDTRFFEAIIKYTGYKPEEHVMVGNDYSKDIIPAKTVGMKTILYSADIGSEKYPCADLVVSDFMQIKDYIINMG